MGGGINANFRSPARPLKKGAGRIVFDMRGGPGKFQREMPAKSVVLLLAAALWAHGETRVWTSADGRKLEAEFVKAEPSGVTVRKQGGETVLIPLNRLSDEDWLYAGRMAEKQKAREEEERKNRSAAEAREKLLKGPLTYQLSEGSETWPEDRRKWIVDAMESAIVFLNEHGDFKKNVTANNSPGTPTADANYDGWINWGGSINRRVALHEIAHTLGIGTHPEWQQNIKDGKWTGKHALKQLREFDGPDAVLYADRMHFWPYGLNFDNESSPENDKRFVKMVTAFRKDLGIR